MSTIVTVTELYMERTGSQTLEGKELTRVFHVITDGKSRSDFIDIWADGNIPNPNDKHPDDDSVVCRGIDPVPDGDGIHWKVTCKYSTLTVDDQPEASDDPTDEEPRITTGFAPYQRAVKKAYDSGVGAISGTQDNREAPSDPVDNSVGDPFDPPVMQEENNLLITIRRNERTIDPDFFLDYENTINNKQIVIAGYSAGVHQARMKVIGTEKRWDNDGVEYWGVTYEVEIDFKTHIRRVLDQGFNKLVSGDRIPIKQKDDSGVDLPNEQVTEPVKLNGSGAILTGGDDPIYLHFQTYYATNWDNLDLPIEA